jgi:hypothetical protein
MMRNYFKIYSPIKLRGKIIAYLKILLFKRRGKYADNGGLFKDITTQIYFEKGKT